MQAEALDVLGLPRFLGDGVLDLGQRRQHHLPVGVDALGDHSLGPLDLRPPPPAVDKRGREIGRDARQPVVEKVPDGLGRRLGPERYPQPGELVGDGGGNTLVGGLDAPFGRADVRAAAEPLGRHARSRQGGHFGQRRKVGRREALRRPADKHGQEVGQNGGGGLDQRAVASRGFDKLPLLEHVGGGFLPAAELERDDLQVVLIGLKLLVQELQLSALLGQGVPCPCDLCGQRYGGGVQVVLAGLDVQQVRVAGRSNAAPEVHLVAGLQAKGEVRGRCPRHRRSDGCPCGAG